MDQRHKAYPDIDQLPIVLRDISPLIWRRLLIRSDMIRNRPCHIKMTEEFMMIKTNGLNHIALKVKDPERTAQFYLDLFNMEITRRTPEMTFLKTIGSTDMITLNRSEADITPEQGMVHFGFIVEPSQFDAALQTIEAKATPIVSGPGTRDQGRYVFISDPSGYTVELFECLLSPYEATD